MVLERMTAKKVRIVDITSGEWVKKEGMEPSFILAKNGEKISRARIMGTVAAKFSSEDGNFGSMTVDDSTDTIRAKTFKTVKPLENVNVGDVVDVIGKIREYNGEVYIIPELIMKNADVNAELLRALEIYRRFKDFKSEPVVDIREDIRKDVLQLIEARKEGATYTDIMKKIDAQEKDIEFVINELLSEGICYEPSPGKIRKI